MPPPPSARRLSVAVSELDGAPRLKHCWPLANASSGETNQKLGLLRLAITNVEGRVTNRNIKREFDCYCQLIDDEAFKEGRLHKLSYAQVDQALRKKYGEHYHDLVFRYTVVGREGGSPQALREALWADAEQMFNFLRTSTAIATDRSRNETSAAPFGSLTSLCLPPR